MDQNNWSCVLSVPSMDMTQGGLSRAVEGLYASLQLLGQREASLWYGRSANPIPLSDGETRMLTLRQLCEHGFRRISPHAIVHDNGIWKPWNLCVSHLALSRGAKLVVSTHGMLSPWALSDRKWKKRVAWLTYQKRILRSASLIFATSEIEVEWIRQCGIDVPIALIPNGIDVPDAFRISVRVRREYHRLPLGLR